MFHTPSGAWLWLQSLEQMCERSCFGRKDQDTAYQAGKRKLLYLKKENHGYNTMHIPSQWAAFRAQWIHRLITPSTAKWKNYVLSGLENTRSGWSLGEHAIFSNIPINELQVSSTWKAFIKTARKPRPTLKPPSRIEDFAAQPVFSICTAKLSSLPPPLRNFLKPESA